MNKRINAIIQLLNDSENIRIPDLASQFQVSQRTIRNDLSEVNALLQQHGLPKLAVETGGLIATPADFEQIMPFISAGDLYAYKLSKEERTQIAATMLVNAPTYVTLGDIAENLFVSRATIINDLDSIRAFLQKENLDLLSKANRGLSVVGKESEKRRFLIQMLRGDPAKHGGAVNRFVSVQAGDRVMIQKIINEQEHIHQSFLTDQSFQDILLCLGIMVDRNLQGEFLEPQAKADDEKQIMAQDIIRYISQYCGVITTEDDIRFLCAMLSHARYIRRSSFERDVVKIQMITRQFIACISEELEINLNNDYEFFENLANHLESVFSAPPTSYPEQEVIEEIIEDNQEVMDAVQRKLSVVSRHIDREITHPEIIYIAIHVCAAIERKKNKEIAFHVIVACHGGIGTSQLLMERLKKHFNFQIVDIISSHEAKNIPEGKADFVISTIPLKNCKLDYVVVSPTFNDSDYIRVGSKIDALRNSRHLPSRVEAREISAKGIIERIRPIIYETVPDIAPDLMRKLRRLIRDYFNQSAGAEAELSSPYLHHLLPQSNIELDVECANWKEAVRRSAQKLLERGYIEERYIDAMIANIEENGPYIVLSPGFAVPHEGLEQGSVRVGMYLIRLKTPVPFGAGEFDPVEFVCCFSAVDRKTHLKAFFNLVNMLQEPDFKRLLHECRTPAEAAAIIEKYEYGTIS